MSRPGRGYASPVGTACPERGAELPVHEGFVTWCHACGWNVVAPADRRPRSGLDRRLDRLAAVLDERLARELLDAEHLEPRLTGAKLAAYAVAAAVHLFVVGLVAGAIVLAALTYPSVPALVIAAIAFAFAWLIRPRLGSVPERGRVERSEAPSLYALVDEVAALLETRSADVIVVNGRVNASWSVVGIRRVRVLRLGLPLLAALTPQARVALIAHEVAHGRNGDLRRGLFVGSALTTLQEIHNSLLPGESLLTYSALGVMDVLARAFLWLLAQPVRGLLLLELHLLLRDMQRAEYLADHLGARVAGSAAMVEAHETFLLDALIEHTVHNAAHGRIEGDSLFETIAERTQSVPERERDRVRRVAALERARLGMTHPPTAARIRLVEERPAQPPLLEPDREASARIDAELAGRRSELAQHLVDRYRAALYR